MKIIEQGHEIISLSDQLLETIEKAGRTCYKSENKITSDSAPKFVKMLRDRKHHAMLEFGDIIVKFITNRGVTHELVRHRLCSFAQESTRYVRYDDDIEFIRPVWCAEDMLGPFHANLTYEGLRSKAGYSIQEALFIMSCIRSVFDYENLLENGWQPQQAREVLPNALKTEIVVKANVREWRHIFQLRRAKAAHPQMRALMVPLLFELKTKLPIIFDDIFDSLYPKNINEDKND